MDENTKVSITLTLSEVQLLNNLIANSTPTVAFGTVTQFVSNINTQLQEQVKELQTPSDPVKVEAEKE